MTSPLEGSLAQTMADALGPALFLTASLAREIRGTPTDPYDPSTGSSTTTVWSCKAIHDEWSLGYKSGGLVSSDDIKILILAKSLPAGVEPLPGDRITLRGETSTIVPATTSGQAAVSTDPAKALWTCRCRS